MSHYACLLRRSLQSARYRVLRSDPIAEAFVHLVGAEQPWYRRNSARGLSEPGTSLLIELSGSPLRAARYA